MIFNIDATPEIDVTGNFSIDCSADITLDAAGNDIKFQAGATHELKFTNSSGSWLAAPQTSNANLTLVENYLDLTIEEVYDVISQVNVWPTSVDDQKKIKFMNSMIRYFINKEEYEKCAFLQEYVNELEDNKQTNRHSGIKPN